jgi:ribonuclease-3
VSLSFKSFSYPDCIKSFSLDESEIKQLVDNIKDKIGYEFINHKLLIVALTHPSSKNQQNVCDYEKLELLGDAVLSMLILDLLINLFPEDGEHILANRKVLLVKGSTIAKIAYDIGLGDLLIMSKSERKNGGGSNASNLENALEALIGAIYLDSNIEIVRKFVHKFWIDIALSDAQLQNPKSMLQEWNQARNNGLPVYELVSVTGASHSPRFTIKLELNGIGSVLANGSSKKDAELKAATMMLDKINSNTTL